jgi:UDP-glucose 4-epimerase
MKILVTGGAGYIGSHTTVQLLEEGHDVTIVDNFSNSSPEVIKRIRQITGKDVVVREGDVRDKEFLESVFSERPVDAVIHFAGLKAVGESVEKPLAYYRNNIDSSLALCEVMQKQGVKKLIFSSSASVYGDAKVMPLRETSPVGAGIISPYGRTKYMIEQILQDLVVSDPSWKVSLLRYFNPIGADKSGLIGDNPNGIPNNLLPYITQVAVGKLAKLHVYGDDYDTIDGTGVRDYIHVIDLAAGHLAALNHLDSHEGAAIYNLGTGKGASVLEMLHAVEKASGKTIPYEVVGRRMGDPDESYADVTKAENELGWKATRTVEEACADSWKWQTMNPSGYENNQNTTYDK